MDLLKIQETSQWFYTWTVLKIKLHLTNRQPFFNERDIWWTSIGVNIGYEQNGKNHNYERPVLVLRKFNHNMLWILPLTSTQKRGKYYFDLSKTGINSRAILSQLRLISSKRLIRKMSRIDLKTHGEIKQAVKLLLN